MILTLSKSLSNFLIIFKFSAISEGRVRDNPRVPSNYRGLNISNARGSRVSSSSRVSPSSGGINSTGTRGSLNSSRSGSIVIGLDNDTRYSLLIQ